MSAYQVASGWNGIDLIHPLPHPYPTMNFSPAPLEKAESTGKQQPLSSILSLFADCGSGSWRDAALAELREKISRQYFSGNWIVVSLDFEENTEKFSPYTIAEKLKQIRDAFGLSIAALADILKVSRASVYNWFESAPRSTCAIKRIEKMYGIAQEWRSQNPYHYAPGRLMKQALGDGPSMIERLSHDELDLDEIRNGMNGLLVLMNKQRERMDRAKARSAKIPANTESHKEILERITGSVTADNR